MRVLNLIGVFVLLSNTVFAQFVEDLAIDIEWSNPITEKIGDNDQLVLNFNHAGYEDLTQGLPQFVYESTVIVTSVKVLSQQFQELDAFEEQLVQNELAGGIITGEVQARIEPSLGGSVIKIIPFRYVNGSLQKLTKFTLQLINKGTLLKKTAATTTANYVSNSVLSSGKWYKIRVSESGIYKLDKSFLNGMGLNTKSIDPRNIQVFGNAGGMLPQANSASRLDDLKENAIQVVGESDGSFDNGDYVLFYGESSHQVGYDSTTNRLQHTMNVYSDANYYFLHVGVNAGKRIQSVNSISNPQVLYNTFDDYLFHEKDLNNIIISGREWLGEKFTFSSPNQSYSFNTTGMVAGSNAFIVPTVVSTSLIITTMDVTADGSNIGTQIIGAAVNGSYGQKGVEKTNVFSIPSTSVIGNSITVGLNFQPGSNVGAEAYLNRIGVQVEKTLQLYGLQTIFRKIDSRNAFSCQYDVSNFANGKLIWDVSNPTDVLSQNYSLAGSIASFSVLGGDIKTFIAFDPANELLEPTFIEELENQNLHGITSIPDMVIITHEKFKEKSIEFAQFKKDYFGLDVTVVTTADIYNEFSSGKQDISAIRDFIRMLYSRDSSKLKYVLLMGDASYDYKNRLADNTNLVPTYESRESFHNVRTYASDDFFGFMDDDAGEWVSNHDLDLGVGRLPVVQEDEIDIIIEKIEQYAVQRSSLGKWRNQVVFVADDDDNTLHMTQADDLVEQIEKNYPSYNADKVYLDAYQQIAGTGGTISPAATGALDEKVEKGALIVNYTGHGSETQWTKEEVLTVNQIQKLKNIQNLPLFVTATCEFGRHDDPKLKCGAEELLLNPGGGAIAMLTTTRPVYSNSNFTLNTAFYNYVFEPLSDSTMRTLGEVMRDTKNNSKVGSNNRNFTLIGDPSLVMAYPEKNVSVDEILNGSLQQTDTIKALGITTINGEVKSVAGYKIPDYNGEVVVTVYDKLSKVKTFGDEASPYEYLSRNNVLYEGKASVKNGSFSVSFVVPKDISYQFEEGKISLYASSSTSLIDAAGANTDIIIGGTDPTAILDVTPPEIYIYMDDYSFVSGGSTNNSPQLLARISDENGINISRASVGHEIVAILDGNTSDPFILNEFYSSDLDSYKNGTIEYPFKNLSEGEHTLTLRVWDTHNNSNEATITFVVDYETAAVHAYPNPAQTFTNFVIEHSRVGENVDVELEIFQPSGNLVRHIEKAISSSEEIIDEINWDLRGEYGEEISAGIYYFRILLRYETGESTISKVNRLILID